MTISVFTPSHDAKYLDDCYYSLAKQTYPNWEWVVLLNKELLEWHPPIRDSRVKVKRADTSVRGVAKLKKLAVKLTTGDIMVELDHDDALEPECLECVQAAFDANPDVGMVYSDYTETDENLDPAQSVMALQPLPHNLLYGEFGPRHVRAYRRSVYNQAGGFAGDVKLDESTDLTLRMYQHAPLLRIPVPLYLKRNHEGTYRKTQTDFEVAGSAKQLYQDRVDQTFLKWCDREGLKLVSLQAAAEPEQRFSTLVTDGPLRIKHPDRSVGILTASNVLQYITDRVQFFNECYRVLAHGGVLLTYTPSTDGRAAFQDPSYKSYWNENSFWYYTQEEFRKKSPGYEGRFQVSFLGSELPGQYHRDNGIVYARANLLALKDGPTFGGPVLI